MFVEYIHIAVRNLAKNRAYAVLGAGGLALGIACALLMVLFIRDELSFDRFHQNAPRIVRVNVLTRFAGNQVPTLPPGKLGPALVASIPGVERAARIRVEDEVVIEQGGEYVRQDGFAYADPDLFRIFDFPLEAGDVASALSRPDGMVISREMAARYFGRDDPIGKRLMVTGVGEYQITGVLATIPDNSTVRFGFVVPFSNLVRVRPDAESWGQGVAPTYLLLAPQARAPEVAGKIPGLLRAQMGPDADRHTFALQPLRDVHLRSAGLKTGDVLSGDVRYLYIFAALALVVLVIACVNYANLATARGARRALEVGVRKAAGATRGQLAGQFLVESALLTVLALGSALVLVQLLLPPFNQLVQKHLTVNYLHDPWIVPSLAALAVVVTLAGGMYPALVLSSFRPADVLRGGPRVGRGRARMRRGLVVIQFTASIALITAALVVRRQLNFVHTTDLGLDPHGVVVITPSDAVKRQYPAFKAELERIPGVEAVTTAPMPGFELMMSVRPEGLQGEESQWISTFPVDPDFVSALGVQLVSGRDFSPDLATDRTGAVLINESLALQLGWAQPVGKTIQRLGDQNEWVTSRVVGVVRDFHNASLKDRVTPKIIQLTAGRASKVLVKIAPGDATATLARIGRTWNAFAPAHPFEYAFLDETFERFYRAEDKLGQTAALFAFAAVMIAAMGLLGLASYTAQTRTKEMGVRKVVGALPAELAVLFLREFAVLVLIAFIIATPIGMLAARRWLEAFAYRTPLGPGPFAAAGGLALVVALVTVGYHTFRVARADPVTSLRCE